MPKPTPIPFAVSSYRRDNSITPEQICRNFIVEKDESGSDTKQVMLLQRPGLDPYLTIGGAVQALYATNNATAGFPQLVGIANNTLYSLDNETVTALGAITGTDPIVAVQTNFDRLCIVAGGLIWLYGASSGTTTNSFRSIAVPSPYIAVDICVLNDYFVIGMSDGTWYWLVPGGDTLGTDGTGSATDPALHFASAESAPDGLVGVRVLNGNIFFFGNTTVEAWQTTGQASQPFERLPNAGYSRGCLARDTIVEVDNSLIWVGDDAKVYRVSSVPEKISTIGIDERLKERTDAPSAWSFSYSGHLYYVLSIPGSGTFAYDVTTQNWSEFASEGHANWRAITGTSINDTVYAGDSQSGAIWKLSDSPTDDGTLIRRTVSASVIIAGKPARNDDVSIEVGADASCAVNLRWADADQTLADQPAVSLDAASGANILTYRRLGQARQPYREFELEITDPAVVRISGARLGDSWQ